MLWGELLEESADGWDAMLPEEREHENMRHELLKHLFRESEQFGCEHEQF